MAAKPQGLEILLGMGKPKGGMRGMSMGGAAGDDDGDEMGPEGEDGPPDELLVGAGQEVMESMQSGDPESFTAALKSFINMVR